MSWLRRRTAVEFPVVPDDKAERDEALIAAQERLQRAVDKQQAVAPLVAALHENGKTNHYIERLRMAYGVHQ